MTGIDPQFVFVNNVYTLFMVGITVLLRYGEA